MLNVYNFAIEKKIDTQYIDKTEHKHNKHNHKKIWSQNKQIMSKQVVVKIIGSKAQKEPEYEKNKRSKYK